MVKEGLVQAYAKLPYRLLSLSQLQFDDVSHSFIQSIDSRLVGVEVYAKYTIDPLILGLGLNETLGLSIDFSTSLDLSMPLSLINQELDLSGLYAVTKKTSDLPQGLVHYSSLEGRISDIENATVHFSDNPHSCQASDSYLEATKVNRNYLVRYLVGQDYDTVIGKIDAAIAEKMSGKARYGAILSHVKLLENLKNIYCTDNLSFSIQSKPIHMDSNNSKTAERPLFVFDPAKNKTSNWANGGLMNYGPFDSDVFNKKRTKFVVLCPSDKKAKVEQFLGFFKNGINSGYYELGFVKKYRLDDLQFNIKLVDIDLQDISKSYERVCLDSLKEEDAYDLALIFNESRYHSPFFKSDPYLVVKSLFMSHGIPVQEIELETMAKPGLAYSLDNIALACYAKLGGIPWTIAPTSTADHELIIGLGSSIVRDSRVATSSRYVGITAVFGSDGNYLFSNLSNEIDYDEYKKELTQSIKDIVSEVADRLAWGRGETLRLIVHQTFKKFANAEIDCVKDAVSEIGDFSTEFAFVNISHEHSHTLFDLNQLNYKGSYAPERGLIVPYRHNAALITVIGPKQMLLPQSSFPKPLLVSVHPASTFSDLEYLSKQVYHFTALSWRAFNPTYVPVTILYSDLIANLMGRLRNVKNWNANIVQSRLRYSRWFL